MRNITTKGDRYCVQLTRRPAVIYGGLFATLAEAEAARDALELLHPRARAGGRPTYGPVREVKPWRKVMGLCPECGGSRECNYVACADCRTVGRLKRGCRR